MRYLTVTLVSLLVAAILLWFGYGEAKTIATRTGERLATVAAPVTKAIKATVNGIPKVELSNGCVTFRSRFWCLPTSDDITRQI